MRTLTFCLVAGSLFVLGGIGIVASYEAEVQALPGLPPGDVLWAKQFGGLGGDNGHKITTDANGDVLVTGYYSGSVDFGGGPLISPGADDVYVAKFSGLNGAHLWSKGFPGTDLAPGSDAGGSVAVDASGNVLITGYFRGTVDFGGGPLTSAGSWDIFVAKLAGTDGSHLWSKRFGDADYDVGYSVAADGNGDVLLAGNFSGTVDFGGGPMTSVGSADIFVSKFSGTDGTHIWSQRFGENGYDAAYGLAVGPSGNVVVTGGFRGTVDFGSGPLTSAGGFDIFVAGFAGADGTHIWSRRFGGGAEDFGNTVIVDASGSVFVTGEFMGPLNFGGGTLTSAGSYDIFLSKFSGVDGTHIWSRRFGGSSDDGGRPVAVDGQGNVSVAGYFCGSVDFGGGALSSSGCGDIFVAQFAGSDGSHLWSKRFGGASHDAGNGVAVDPAGDVLLTGSFQGAVDFGG